MKVLHIISGDLWAGAEMQAYTLISALRRKGNVEVAAAVMNEGELARRLRQAGVEVSLFDESRLGVRRILSGLGELMARWQPDVIHTHRTKENVLGSLANRLGRNVPALRSVHGASEYTPRGFKSKLRHAVIGRLDSWCAHHAQERIIAVSSELAEKLASTYPREKITVIVNGVDAEAVLAQRQPVEFRERYPTAKHLGIVGRLVPVKRVDLFLQTAAALARAEPDRAWRFHVFGDGPLKDTLMRQAEALGLAEVVTFHGHRNDIVACMAGLDAVVMCSDHEGLPMTALEAVVLDVPMIAHAVGGLTDIVPRDLLVERHDASGYAAALLAWAARPSCPEHVAARRRVLEEYSCAVNATRTLTLYEELVRSRAVRPS